MFCYNCGKELDEKAVVCPNCGVVVNEAALKAAQEAQAKKEAEEAAKNGGNKTEAKDEFFEEPPQQQQTTLNYSGASNSAPQPVSPSATNALAIVGFVLSFFVSLAGLICSAIALKQIKRTGEGGYGLALAGVILGAVSLGLTVLIFIFYFSIIGCAVCSTACYPYGL